MKPTAKTCLGCGKNRLSLRYVQVSWYLGSGMTKKRGGFQPMAVPWCMSCRVEARNKAGPKAWRYASEKLCHEAELTFGGK